MAITITLEACLKLLDVSARELSRRCGVHRDTIGKYRHNTVRIVDLNILEAFAVALDVRLKDLLSDSAPDLSPHGQTRRPGVHLPLPDGTVCPTPADQMSVHDLEQWLSMWYAAWE